MRRTMLPLLLLPALASAAPRMLVLAAGDCQDAELVAGGRALHGALREAPGRLVVAPQEVAEKLAPEPAGGLDEVHRRLDVAQNQFYNGRYEAALRGIEDAVRDILRMPVEADRWELYRTAQLLAASTYRAQRRTKESEEAFRQVLRLQPDFRLDVSLYSDGVRQVFERLRRELAAGPKTRLTVQSTRAHSTVYVNGRMVGASPVGVDLPPGGYLVQVQQGEARSFVRWVEVAGPELGILVDLDFESSVRTRPFPCVAAQQVDEVAQRSAVKVAGLLGADEVVVVRVERHGAGPEWLAATLVGVEGGQRLREGGFKMQPPEAQGASFAALAEYVTTGRARDEVVVLTGERAPWATEPAASASPPGVQAEPREASGRGLRTGAYVAAGSGVVALTVAGIARLAARSDSKALDGRLNADGRIPAGDAEGKRLSESLRRKNTVITAGLVTGGAALVTAGALFYLSRDSDGVGIVVAPGLSGVFAEAAVRF